jgi:hypothetical protein
MRVFYGNSRGTVSFIRAKDACRYGRIWVAMYKAKTWRDFVTALPAEYADFFEADFEDDSDLDRPLDPDHVMSSYDGYFPPGLPDGLVRQWMPDEIVERFGDPVYDRNVSFDGKHAEEILAILRREGYECVDACDLVAMMRFGRIDRNHSNLSQIERLLEATEQELSASKNKML